MREFANCTSSSMRTDDILGRLGGEEFAAIVSAPSDVTAKIAERIRGCIEAAGAVVSENTIGTTVSIGVACSPLADADVEALLARADAALYRAKGEGRNRVQVAEDGPSDTAHLIATVRVANRAAGAGVLRRSTGASVH